MLIFSTGYPFSVPNEYSRYQVLNLIQDLCSYLRGIMSTQAILVGLGWGNKEITGSGIEFNNSEYQVLFLYCSNTGNSSMDSTRWRKFRW